MFWNRRINYRAEVNTKIEAFLGFKATNIFPVLSYAEQLDKAYDSKFSTTAGSFYVLILFYVSAIECGGDSSKQALLLRQNGFFLNDFLNRILNDSLHALQIDPNSRADIIHLLSFINKAHEKFGFESVILPT
jgi:hypothetical protein